MASEVFLEQLDGLGQTQLIASYNDLLFAAVWMELPPSHPRSLLSQAAALW